MYIFGCLPVILIVFGLLLAVFVINTILRLVNGTGAGAIYLWESFLNFFRKEKKEVINPFNGESNFDNARQDEEIRYSPTEQRPKRYESTDGEVVEFEDLSDEEN